MVDDASPDDTAAVLARIEGLRVVSHPDNRGFVDSCNDGAAAARGEVLLFLNNDTQVTPGWLDALLAACARKRTAASSAAAWCTRTAACRKPAAWCMTTARGSNIGRFDERHDPRYRFRREVDYVSGASLMIDRAPVREGRRFRARFAPAYYEDTDLAFAVRAAGRRVTVRTGQRDRARRGHHRRDRPRHAA